MPDSVTDERQTIASVDLGSNSFHMVVAHASQADVNIVDRLKDPVRLAAGLDADGQLSDEAQTRALACLQRFNERLGEVPASHLRAVGTNTLRKARNSASFLDRAQNVLGHPIEIIAGREEARLIYLGVAHTLAGDGDRRLVIDIGGGSTECIVGERFEPLQADSLYMGCVTYSRDHFADGAITAKRMERAELAALRELEPIVRRYQMLGWDACVGASGTIGAVDAVLRSNEWGTGEITAKGMRRLRKRVIAAGHADALALDGMPAERAPVFAGGVAILSALFTAFDVERMDFSTGALREGLLYDIVGRIHDEDHRDLTIERLAEVYTVDREQAARVEATAVALLRRVQKNWDLAGEMARKLLVWAARVYEIGLRVSYSGYHRHGGYLIANSDMPGFSRDDQVMLAALVRGHRRKIRDDTLIDVPPARRDLVLRLTVLLRLAVVLNRSRSPEPVPSLNLAVQADRATLFLPDGWLDDHPLVRADLDVEAPYLKRVGVELVIG